MTADFPARQTLVRQAMLLEAAIISYNLLEGVLSVAAGIMAGSVVLVGFGLDSAIEVSAALVVLWHLSRSGEEQQPDWEGRVARFVGLTLLLVAAYVAVRAVTPSSPSSEPEESYLGLAITATSVIVMPVVSRLQASYARKIESVALLADSRETLVCTYLSALTPRACRQRRLRLVVGRPGRGARAGLLRHPRGLGDLQQPGAHSALND